MSEPAEATAIETSVDMLTAAMKMRAALDKEAKRWLRTEKVVYNQEFNYPRTTNRECWFLVLLYTVSAGLFIMAIPMVPLALFVFLEPDTDIGPVLVFIFLMAFFNRSPNTANCMTAMKLN